MEDFEDKQSCAEDWPDPGIDPLVCRSRLRCPFLCLATRVSTLSQPIFYISIAGTYQIANSVFSSLSRRSASQKPLTIFLVHRQATGHPFSA
jgi:hypothetical protein